MSSFVQTYYHIVYSTKHRKPVLAKEQRRRMFEYMYGVLKNKKCHLYRLNGTEDHIHMLASVHPTVAVSVLIRELKTATTAWIRDKSVFHDFPGWQAGYGAFTQSHSDKDRLIEYSKGQEEHHRKESSLEEFRRLLGEAGIEFEERYLE